MTDYAKIVNLMWEEHLSELPKEEPTFVVGMLFQKCLMQTSVPRK